MTFRAVFVTGGGVIANPDVLLELQAAIGTFRGQHIDLTVEAHRDRRSEQANRYLWGHVYREIAAYTGHSVEAIHDAMVAQFLPSERTRVEFFNRTTGEVLEIDTDRRRTSKLTGKSFFDFVDAVRLFASEFLSIETEDPDPEYWRGRLVRPRPAALRLHDGDPCNGD